MTQNYFHMTTANLAPGSVLNPGNFGRVLHKYAYQHVDPASAWRLSSELVFELVRRERFPNLPSRFESCFLFLSESDAIKNRAKLGFTDVIYRVEIIDSSAPQHVGAFNLITYRFPSEGTEFLSDQIQRANLYWSGEGIECAELLTASAIKIVEKMEHGHGFSLSNMGGHQ